MDLILAAWQLALRLAVWFTEETLRKRAQQPTDWSNCPRCEQKLHSKGFAKRQLTTLIGVIRFSRRVGRCPARCRIGQVAPLDTELELTPHQRSDLGLKRVACLLAVFVPYQTAQILLDQLISVHVCKDTIWNWVQDAGKRAIETLNDQLNALTQHKAVTIDWNSMRLVELF